MLVIFYLVTNVKYFSSAFVNMRESFVLELPRRMINKMLCCWLFEWKIDYIENTEGFEIKNCIIVLIVNVCIGLQKCSI